MDPETLSLRRAANHIMEFAKNSNVTDDSFWTRKRMLDWIKDDTYAKDLLDRLKKGKFKEVTSDDLVVLGVYYARRGLLEDPLDFRGINTVTIALLNGEDISNVFNIVNPLHTKKGRVPIEWAKPHEKDAWKCERRAREAAAKSACAPVRVPLVLDEEPEPDLRPSGARDTTTSRVEFKPTLVRLKCEEGKGKPRRKKTLRDGSPNPLQCAKGAIKLDLYSCHD